MNLRRNRQRQEGSEISQSASSSQSIRTISPPTVSDTYGSLRPRSEAKASTETPNSTPTPTTTTSSHGTTTFQPIIVSETSLPYILTQDSDGSWGRSSDGWLIYGRASSDSVFAGSSYVFNNGTDGGTEDGSGDLVTMSGTAATAAGSSLTATSPPSTQFHVTDALPYGWGQTSDRGDLYAVPLIVVASVVLSGVFTGFVVLIIIARAKAKRKAHRKKRRAERRAHKETMAALTSTMNAAAVNSSTDTVGGVPLSASNLRRMGSTDRNSIRSTRTTESSIIRNRKEDEAEAEDLGRANLGNLGQLFRELHASRRYSTTGGVFTAEQIVNGGFETDAANTRPAVRASTSGRTARRRVEGWRQSLRRRQRTGNQGGGTTGGDQGQEEGVDDGADLLGSPRSVTESIRPGQIPVSAVDRGLDEHLAVEGAGTQASNVDQSSALPPPPISTLSPPAYNRPTSIRRPDSPDTDTNSINRDYYDPHLPSFSHGENSTSATAAAAAAAAMSARQMEKSPATFYPAPTTTDMEEAQAVAYGSAPHAGLYRPGSSANEGDETGPSTPAPAFHSRDPNPDEQSTPIGGHLATDDKEVLERLRMASSLPTESSEALTLHASAPDLDVDEDGFERMDLGGEIPPEASEDHEHSEHSDVLHDGVRTPRSSSVLPLPPKPVVYQTSVPSAPPTPSLPDHLHLLASSPLDMPAVGAAPTAASAPMAPSSSLHLTVPSAPALEDEDGDDDEH